MHAEITNTPNPGASLDPCRVCTLSVSKKKFKTTQTFLYQFRHQWRFVSEVNKMNSTTLLFVDSHVFLDLDLD
jgi:hypothetical protein